MVFFVTVFVGIGVSVVFVLEAEISIGILLLDVDDTYFVPTEVFSVWRLPLDAHPQKPGPRTLEIGPLRDRH